jgi:hypothetical protein
VEEKTRKKTYAAYGKERILEIERGHHLVLSGELALEKAMETKITC